MTDWLGGDITPLAEGEGYAALVRRWLTTFGPGELTDLQWWLGCDWLTFAAARHDRESVDPFGG